MRCKVERERERKRVLSYTRKKSLETQIGRAVHASLSMLLGDEMIQVA